MKHSLRSPIVAANRCRALGFVVSAILLSLLPNCVLGQYLHFHNSLDGKAAMAVYQGNAGWLADQKDEKSHLHEVKELVALKLVQHDISLAEMRYVASLKQLRHLTLGDAPESVKIGGPAFAVLGDCRSLEGVWICKKQPRDDDIRVLQKLPSLRYVTIEEENLCDASASPTLTDRAAELLASIKTLEAVSFRANGLFSNHAVEELAKLPKLKSLEIYSSRLTDDGVQALSGLTDLEELQMGGKLTTKSIEHLRALHNLRELSLGVENIPKAGMETIAAFEHLEVLSLNLARIGDDELAALRDHPSLKRLFLNRAKVTDGVLPILHSLKKLEYVELHGNEKARGIQEAVNKRIKGEKAARGAKQPESNSVP